MRRLLRNNGLTLALAALFLATWLVGQVVSGFKTHNEERRERGVGELPLGDYLRSAHFAEATAENWESEFLQMFVFVLMTAWLCQRGSAESDDPEAPPDPPAVTAASPWPVRRGGWVRALYGHSLSLAFLALFLASFTWHLTSSRDLENEERAQVGKPPVTLAGHLAGARFWFESLQNWQSEFLAMGSMVVLSIFLRERNSPESKAVEAPHSQTGA